MITVNVKSLLIYLVFIALIIFLIYLTVMVRHLIKTLKETNQILEDAAVVSGIAADKATALDEVVGDVQGAVSDVAKAIKGNENLIGSLTNIAKAIGSLIALFKKDDAKK